GPSPGLLMARDNFEYGRVQLQSQNFTAQGKDCGDLLYKMGITSGAGAAAGLLQSIQQLAASSAVQIQEGPGSNDDLGYVTTGVRDHKSTGDFFKTHPDTEALAAPYYK